MRIPAKAKCDEPGCEEVEDGNLNAIAVVNRDGGRQYDLCDEHYKAARDGLPEYMQLDTIAEQEEKAAAAAAAKAEG
jgi:hypothetical protein